MGNFMSMLASSADLSETSCRILWYFVGECWLAKGVSPPPHPPKWPPQWSDEVVIRTDFRIWLEVLWCVGLVGNGDAYS